MTQTFDRDMMDLMSRAIEDYCLTKHNFIFNPRSPKVRLHEPSFGPQEILAALDVLLSTHVTQGKLVRTFETAHRNALLPTSFPVACNSGSSANLLAIAALCSLGDLRPGDEVIVPALSWSTTIWPLVQYGLIPVFVDCDKDTFCMSPEATEKALTSRTRAIMPIHLYGNPCDMEGLGQATRTHNPVLIEDCCESMGASYNFKPVGTLADVSTFSYYYSHHITALEGGMVCTPHSDILDKLRIQRSHGWTRELDGGAEPWKKQYGFIDPKFLFVDTGYNLRMTEVNAAIGLEQIPKLPSFVDIRRENNLVYRQQLEMLEKFDFQREEEGSSSFGFCMLVREDAGFDPDELRRFLFANDIETRPIVAGNMTKQPAMAKIEHRAEGPFPNTDRIMKRGFAVGNHHLVNPPARDYVIDKIREFVNA